MRCSPRFPTPLRWLLAASLFARPSASEAQPTPVHAEFTNVNSVVYNADNRNARPGDVSRALDDEWGAVFNRLNAQTSYGSWRLSARLDSAWFYTSRSPTDVALSLVEQSRVAGAPYTEQDAELFINKFFESGTDRNTRFTDWTYPSKYALSYTTPDVEATVGDFYAQFGRGLVLSVRKQDELSSDTTVRGIRISGSKRWDNWRLRATALGGNLNPLRIDSASGRFLGVRPAGATLIDRWTEAAMPQVVGSDFVPEPRPTYLPDTLYGGELEVKHPHAQLSLHGIGLERGCLGGPEVPCLPLSADLSRSASSVRQGGAALEFPSIADIASVYLEYAHQTLVFPGEAPAHAGDAVYLAASLAWSRVSTTIEAKHVRGYQTLAAGIDSSRAPEFSTVVYNLVPILHPVWNDTQFENFGTCISGGRVRNDVDLGSDLNWFATVGYYQTYGEVGPASCDPAPSNLNRVWDLAQGIEAAGDGGKSTILVLFGTRFDDTDLPRTNDNGRDSTNYYREAYIRYDIVRSIGGNSSVQLQGWHRRRHQLLGGPEHPWLQGITTTALQLGAHWNLALGIEYDQNPAFPSTYFSGQVRYNVTPSNNVNLFVGQQRGGLRCVSGVCRIFPPFEGVRLESTLRF